MADAVFASEGYTVMLDALLAGLVPHVRLYTNDPDLNEDRVRADFTEPVMDDYAPIPAVVWTPSALRDGRAISVVDPIFFTYTGGPLPDPIRGYIVTAGADGPLLWAVRRPGDAFVFSDDEPLLSIFMRMRWPLLCA